MKKTYQKPQTAAILLKSQLLQSSDSGDNEVNPYKPGPVISVGDDDD